MKRHWIWAGGFLALSVFAIVLGAVRGVSSGMAALEREHAALARAHGPAAGEHGTPKGGHESKPGHHVEGEAKGSVAEDSDERLRKEMRAAIFLGRQGEFEAARKILEQLAARHPDRAAVWLNLGIAQVGMEDLDAARRAFEQVLAINPRDWDAVAELANLALERGDLSRALTLVEVIPPGEGRMIERLQNDERWRSRTDDPGVRALRTRHGLEQTPDTSERLARALSARRTEAAASRPDAPGPSPPPAAGDRPDAPPPTTAGTDELKADKSLGTDLGVPGSNVVQDAPLGLSPPPR